jgi:hypothetical protein
MKTTSTLHVVTPTKRKKDTRVGLLNPSFVYTPAAKTDVRATLDRIRAEMAQRGTK